ncbi:hypothetical protein [Marinifilum sp. D714]|uniref:hypothetical protein n=1 Tax=Marinifilum sp. D714 TaxID=2937523 RepID=UPI0027BD9617|nr:hypothetical protein [Marinifilum sp. D714]MDQ2180687.1 hypothetical protein [Marinifilum sp. D714]
MKKPYKHLIFIGVNLIVIFITISILNYFIKGEFDIWDNATRTIVITVVLFLMNIFGWLKVKKKK